MNIEETIKDIKNNLDGGYINLDTNDLNDIVNFTEELLELAKHYSNRDIWLATPQNIKIDDWYDYKNHNGYDAARDLLAKWGLK